MEEQNFVPDYEEGDSRSLTTPATPRSRKKKWLRTCPGCGDKYPHLKRHSLCNHLPFYTDPIPTCWECEKVQLQQNRTFQHLAVHVNGGFNLERLFSWCYLMCGLLHAISISLSITSLPELLTFAQRTEVYVEEEPPFDLLHDVILHLFDEIIGIETPKQRRFPPPPQMQFPAFFTGKLSYY